MVRIGNFVTNQPTKPFNTNWYILRRHTLSRIVVLQKFMNFSELCCFLKITTAKTISRSKKSIFLRFKQILEKEVLWVYVVIILIVISKRGDVFKTQLAQQGFFHFLPTKNGQQNFYNHILKSGQKAKACGRKDRAKVQIFPSDLDRSSYQIIRLSIHV